MTGRSYSGKRGHLSKNCWSKLRNKETAKKAHVAQSEENEPALFFMVTASVLLDGITALVSVELEEEL